MRAETNRRLCELAVSETGIGNAVDKQRKNVRKTLGFCAIFAVKKPSAWCAKTRRAGLLK